ncbi:hypothetical protein ECP02989421_5329 [Escherichia coli P0298942.1]|nr:hypothetical protein ECP02989421_5329 [Escherichia coli P0298942.1]
MVLCRIDLTCQYRSGFFVNNKMEFLCKRRLSTVWQILKFLRE